MLTIAIEIGICALLGVGVILALIVVNRTDRGKWTRNGKPTQLDFLPISINEEMLVQSALMIYYEQQRDVLIARQNRAELDKSTTNAGETANNDSGYTSVPSSSHTPHSVYECTGFASMDNVEVSNPLFASDLFNDQAPPRSLSTKT